MGESQCIIYFYY